MSGGRRLLASAILSFDGADGHFARRRGSARRIREKEREIRVMPSINERQTTADNLFGCINEYLSSIGHRTTLLLKTEHVCTDQCTMKSPASLFSLRKPENTLGYTRHIVWVLRLFVQERTTHACGMWNKPPSLLAVSPGAPGPEPVYCRSVGVRRV